MAARGGLVDLFRDLAVRRDKIGSTVRALRRIGDVIFRHGQLQRVRQAACDLHRADIGQLRHDIPGDARTGEREQVVALSHAAGSTDLVGSIICRARHLHGAHAEEQHHAQHDGSDDRRHDENTLPDAGIDPAARAVPRALALLLAQLLQMRLLAPLVTALLRSLCCAGISLRRPAPRLVFLVFHGVHPSVGLVSVL